MLPPVGLFGLSVACLLISFAVGNSWASDRDVLLEIGSVITHYTLLAAPEQCLLTPELFSPLLAGLWPTARFHNGMQRIRKVFVNGIELCATLTVESRSCIRTQ
jgi:hypothetical protein